LSAYTFNGYAFVDQYLFVVGAGRNFQRMAVNGLRIVDGGLDGTEDLPVLMFVTTLPLALTSKVA